MSVSLRIPVLISALLAAFSCAASPAAARPGTPDPTFGTNGVVSTAPASGGREAPSDLAETPDGGYVIAGSATTGSGSIVFKYLSDGSPDPTFGVSGQLRSPGDGWDQVEVLGDGKILLASGAGTGLTFVRLNPDGSPDTSFGGTGTVTLSTSGLFTPPDGVTADASVSSLVALGDGSLRAIGTFAGCQSSTYGLCGEAFLAGIDGNGNPDTTFGSGGVKNTGILGTGILSATLPDGRSVVVRSETGDPPYGDVLRSTSISADGVTGEAKYITRGNNYYWSNLDVYPGGTAFVSGDRIFLVDADHLWKLLPDGDRDPDFGTDGMVELRDLTKFLPDYPGFIATGVAVDGQGRLLVSGAVTSGAGKKEWGGDSWASTGAAARLNADGSIDPSFGGGGLQILWHGRRAHQHLTGNTQVLVSGGNLVVSGMGPNGGSFGFTLARAANDEMEMPTCGGRTADYAGSSGDDRIQVYGSEVVVTGGGDDRVQGGFDSVVCSGPGDDVVNIDRGKSTVYGGTGSDRISLGTQDSYAHGGPGDDVIRGGTRRDRLFGNDGDDLLLGGNRDDRLFGGKGTDRLFGQGGRDWLFGGPGKDLLKVGPVKPDPTDYLTKQPGGFMRVTTLGRKANTTIRVSMVCEGTEPSHSYLNMRSIAFDPATGRLSNLDGEQQSLDDDFVFIADIQARVKNGRMTGRFRYIEGESYYDNYLCRTGSGTVNEKTALRDAWVPFSGKVEPKPRQLAMQN